MKSSKETLEQQVRLGAIRFLHSLDMREKSSTTGICDREYWSWKTKDFPNGTWQAGLSGFLDASELIDLNKDEIQQVVRTVVLGTRTIQRKNGSFEEAYPFESSYCVTSLVLFNLLYCYYRHTSFFDSQIWPFR